MIIAVMIIASAAGFSQDEAKKITVTKGEAVNDGIKYPVYKGVTEVEANQFGGIQFTLTFKNGKQAMDGAKKVMNFYKGKKITRHTIKKFTKVGKPDTTGWIALDCAGDTGATVAVSVYENEVSVRVIGACVDAGMLF